MTFSITLATNQQCSISLTRNLATAFCAFGLGTLVSMLFGWLSEPKSSSASNEHVRQISEVNPLGLTMEDFDFGVVEPGGRKTAIVWIRNTLREPIKITRVVTSCHCITAQVSTDASFSHGSYPLLITFDLSDDPYFLGKLAVAISIVDSLGNRIRLGQVTAEVSNDDQVAALLRHA